MPLPFDPTGKSTTTTTGAGGADFTTQPQGKSPPKGGGRDFTTESRPQPPMKMQAGLPNTEGIPAGGKILKADPGPVSQKVSGAAPPIGSVRKPFRVGK